MATLLFPGRHLAHTTFQQDYITQALHHPIEDLEVWTQQARPDGMLDQIVFAITSSNQQYSRYNPLPYYLRSIGVDRFARSFREQGIASRIIGIPHYGHIPHFAENTLKEIREQTEGELILTPENTVVMCSTPVLIAMYQQLGFAILPAELNSLNPELYKAKTPLNLVGLLADGEADWHRIKTLHRELSPATIALWDDYPEIPRMIQTIYREPLLNAQGSLTDTRNYAVYGFGMSNRDILEVKYKDIKAAIVPGRIVDEGCADGGLLTLVARDFPDSDLIGIEITGEFLAKAQERQRQGEFGESFVHFHQRNILAPVLEPESVDTIICNSTTHELWSYVEQEKTIRTYFAMKFEQNRKGGRLLLRDVVGPEEKEREVYLWCNANDGSNEDIFKSCSSPQELDAHLKGLSTQARFYRFAQDFLAEQRAKGKRGSETQISYIEEKIGDTNYLVLSLKDVVEFMTHKDYTENYQSECNEEFAFWNFSQYKRLAQEIGYSVIENPNHPEEWSRAYTSSWIEHNRWEGKVKLYTRGENGLNLLANPVTNMVLVLEKR